MLTIRQGSGGLLGLGVLIVLGVLFAASSSTPVQAGVAGARQPLGPDAPPAPAQIDKTTPTALPPVCPTPPPTRIPTPAYTPAPGCAASPRPGDLQAVITDHPSTTEALFTNHSATCSYPIGLAVYEKYDASIDHQQLYAYALAVIPPNSTLVLTVANPVCAYQGDAFWGDLIESFAGGVRYGERRLDDTASVNRPYCRACATPPPATATPAPTDTPTATRTVPPTSPPTSTPTTTPTNTPSDTPTDTATRTPPPTYTATLSPTGTFTSTPPPTLVPTVTPACSFGWELVPSPNIGTRENQLWDVAGLGPNDIWAVGHYVDNALIRHTMTQHWDGQTWTIIPSAEVPGIDNRLIGVAAISTNDVWAVGTHKAYNNQPLLIEHWNGTAWSIVPAPTPAAVTRATYLHSVSAVTTDDVWAAGSYTDGSGFTRALVVHWDGAAWSLASPPNLPGNFSEFYDVTALAHDNVWVVGHYNNGRDHALIAHWDGTSWTLVPSPDTATSDRILWRLDGVSANDLWAVGIAGGDTILLERWDGQAWSLVPNFGNIPRGGMYGLAVRGARDIWAVGTGSPLYVHNVTLHWNGSGWQTIPSVEPGSTINNFRSAAVVPNDTVWAVGNFTNGQNKTMIERVVTNCPKGSSGADSRP